MIATAYNPEQLILLCVVGSPPTLDADYERVLAAFERLARESAPTDALCTNVVVVDRDHDLPDARWRRRIAEAEKKCRRLRMALVTESAMARGVITAIQWLTGSRDTLQRSTHATLAEASLALEREAGRQLRLAALHDAARADMATRLAQAVTGGARR
jgi:hypothetical protein